MMTLQGMRMRTDYMIEQIRIRAIEDTFEKFKEADRKYYQTSEGGDNVTKLYKELEELGANMEKVIDADLQIRDETCGLPEIVAMFRSTLNMDDGYINHIAIISESDGFHNHFLYDKDKGKGAAGTGPHITIEDARQDVIAHFPDAVEEV